MDIIIVKYDVQNSDEQAELALSKTLLCLGKLQVTILSLKILIT